MIRRRIAYVLRSFAEALELEDDDQPTEYDLPTNAQRPDELSEPLDVGTMWREMSADFAAEGDEWIKAGYL